MMHLNSPDTLYHWLKGYIDLNGAPPSESQWATIKARVSQTTLVPMMPVIPPGYAPPHQPCGCKEKKAE